MRILLQIPSWPDRSGICGHLWYPNAGLEYLRSLPEIRRTISATAIAKALSLGDVQVRKDLASVCGAGKPKIGYETDKLITDIESHLGYERLIT